jgi:hypothetical protein
MPGRKAELVILHLVICLGARIRLQGLIIVYFVLIANGQPCRSMYVLLFWKRKVCMICCMVIVIRIVRFFSGGHSGDKLKVMPCTMSSRSRRWYIV